VSRKKVEKAKRFYSSYIVTKETLSADVVEIMILSYNFRFNYYYWLYSYSSGTV